MHPVDWLRMQAVETDARRLWHELLAVRRREVVEANVEPIWPAMLAVRAATSPGGPPASASEVAAMKARCFSSSRPFN
jgi:hypothetical protein